MLEVDLQSRHGQSQFLCGAMFDERRRHDSNGGNVSPDAATPSLECRDARSRAHELYCAEDFQLIESIRIESGGAPTGGISRLGCLTRMRDTGGVAISC